MQRVFAFDLLKCPRCQGRRRVLSAVTDKNAIQAFLVSQEIPFVLPYFRPARPPPLLDAASDDWPGWDDRSSLDAAA
jgi:hypothetical protein